MNLELNPINISEMSLQGCYKLIIVHKLQQNPEAEIILEKIRYGINIKFPIWWIWQKDSLIIPKRKSKIVIIDGKGYEENEYVEEKELREAIMKEFLLRTIEPEDEHYKGMEKEVENGE